MQNNQVYKRISLVNHERFCNCFEMRDMAGDELVSDCGLQCHTFFLKLQRRPDSMSILFSIRAIKN